MAYSFSINNAPSTGSVAVFQLKAALKAAGWTVPRSSDGTTYNSSGDQITVSGSGAGGMSNASAWFVIQQPSGGRQFCFQRTSNTNWRVKYSPSAGFTGGSPGATQTPSAADERVLIGGGSDASPTFTQWFAADNGYYWHIGCGGAAENYSFYAFGLTKTTAAGINNAAMFLDPLMSGTYPNADTDPVVVNMQTNSAGSAIFTSANLDEAAQGAQGLMGASTFSRLSACEYRRDNGGVVLPAGTGTNPWSTSDDLVPFAYARATATAGYKGISSMLRYGGVLRTNTDTSTDLLRIFVGEMWLPWDGVTTPLV